jgi:hypothetical protein
VVASVANTPFAAAATRTDVSDADDTESLAVAAGATVNCFAAATGAAGGIVIPNICSGTADIASAAGPALAAG